MIVVFLKWRNNMNTKFRTAMPRIYLKRNTDKIDV